MARLNGDDYRAWLRAFEDAFDDLDAFGRLVLFASGGKTLDTVAGRGPLNHLIEVVIRKADEGGWLKKLLDEALEMQPDRRLLRDLQADLEILTIIEPDSPFDATRIFGDAMFDRLDLRARLRALQGDGAPPILVVLGERYSGKTWSTRLISHVANNIGDVTLVPVDMEPHVGTPVDAALIGRLIAEEGDLENPPCPNEEQPAQWVKQYCSWLARSVKQAGGALWVIIDHLEKVTISDDAKEFLYCFGKSIPLKMPKVRLIILSYHEPDELEAKVGRVEYERVPMLSLDQIKEGLATFFAIEFLARQRASGAAADLAALQPKVAVSTEAVLKKLTADDPRLLVTMAGALREELKRIVS
jgi:hypothetical protein